jgi:hypothetical protein
VLRPAGHVYISGRDVYGRVEPAGREACERLMQSGLSGRVLYLMSPT